MPPTLEAVGQIVVFVFFVIPYYLKSGLDWLFLVSCFLAALCFLATTREVLELEALRPKIAKSYQHVTKIDPKRSEHGR